MEYLTVPEAAKEADVTPNALYNAMREGRLKHTEKYGKRLIPRPALEDYKTRTAGVGKTGGKPRKAVGGNE